MKDECVENVGQEELSKKRKGIQLTQNCHYFDSLFIYVSWRLLGAPGPGGKLSQALGKRDNSLMDLYT